MINHNGRKGAQDEEELQVQHSLFWSSSSHLVQYATCVIGVFGAANLDRWRKHLRASKKLRLGTM